MDELTRLAAQLGTWAIVLIVLAVVVHHFKLGLVLLAQDAQARL